MEENIVIEENTVQAQEDLSKMDRNQKAKKRSKWNKIIAYIVLIVCSCIMILPLLILLCTSLKPYEELVENPTAIFPKQITFEAFATVFNENPYFVYLSNTVFITVVNVIACCFTSAFVAYGFVRFRVKGSGFIFGAFLSGMLIPGQVLTIPMFEVYKSLGWINTFFPFIVPCWFGGGIFNVFLQRQFIRGIPSSLFEAAEIDGCNEMEIFFRIVMRLVAHSAVCSGYVLHELLERSVRAAVVFGRSGPVDAREGHLHDLQGGNGANGFERRFDLALEHYQCGKRICDHTDHRAVFYCAEIFYRRNFDDRIKGVIRNGNIAFDPGRCIAVPV